ncbi:hypothetical protein [Yeosuana sp. AK3]
MAPTKFEDSIKNKLEKRTILPSSDAWNRLEERLDASKPKKTKPFLWIGIAASLVGILLVVSQFFNNETKETITPVLVESPTEINANPPTHSVAEDAINKDTLHSLENEKNKLKSYSKEVKTIVKVEPKTTDLKTVTNHVTTIEKNKLNLKEINPILLKPELSFEEQKIEDIVAQVKILQENNSVITDEAMEALLQKAQKEIREQPLFNESTSIVDARLLLEDVEADLDKSFRDKVLETLKANFNFVKTAMAQRND